VLDYVVIDGKGENSVEGRFCKALDTSADVVVYAKLPGGFKIPTPVGNYTPDWAIAFEEDRIKYLYFVAETKGSLSSLDLRPIEKAKIDCARKLFDTLSTESIRYDYLETYEDLMDLVQS